jgi:hypothetical protein
MLHDLTDMPSGTFRRYPLHVFVIELRQDRQVCHEAALSRVTLAHSVQAFFVPLLRYIRCRL